jgi:hypothetical protein
MYSAEQRDWLFNELSQADKYHFVIWASSKPWIGKTDLGDDNWTGQPNDRSDLSSWISTALARRRIYWSSPAMLICSPLMTAVTPIMATVLVMFHRFRSSSQDPWIDLVVPRVGLTRTAVTQSKSKGITNTAPYHSKLTVQNHVWR